MEIERGLRWIAFRPADENPPKFSRLLPILLRKEVQKCEGVDLHLTTKQGWRSGARCWAQSSGPLPPPLTPQPTGRGERRTWRHAAVAVGRRAGVLRRGSDGTAGMGGGSIRGRSGRRGRRSRRRRGCPGRWDRPSGPRAGGRREGGRRGEEPVVGALVQWFRANDRKNFRTKRTGNQKHDTRGPT